MTSNVLQIAGGLGLFLLGMVTMSDGLRSLAGAAIQQALRRFTRSPASGAVTGTFATAIVQSSSITTVSAVGFASAGLLSFPEALGIVLGANIGTTITGWMVALLGFKLKIGLLMPVAVLVGVLLRLFGNGRLSSFGHALAGFGLVFIGIDMLREGAMAFEGIITPERFPSGGFFGRVQLVGIGIAVTLVTQSSSAGVVATLAGLSAGALEFDQAAALVIGMDVGTTVTAVLATIGASLAGRRTGWAHVLYNLITASAALLLLPLYEHGLDFLWPGVLVREPELAVVGFHSFFNVAGVSLVLPFARPFARLVEWIVPERPSTIGQRLESRLLDEPELALRALAPVLRELSWRSFAVLRSQLSPSPTPPDRQQEVDMLSIALEEILHYLSRMTPSSETDARRAAALHVVDQLHRLLARESQADRAGSASRSPKLASWVDRLARALPAADADDPERALFEAEPSLGQLCSDLEAGRRVHRDTVAQRVTRGELDADGALERMDAYRWLERAAHHAWRVSHHLIQLAGETPTDLLVEPPEPD